MVTRSTRPGPDWCSVGEVAERVGKHRTSILRLCLHPAIAIRTAGGKNWIPEHIVARLEKQESIKSIIADAPAAAPDLVLQGLGAALFEQSGGVEPACCVQGSMGEVERVHATPGAEIALGASVPPGTDLPDAVMAAPNAVEEKIGMDFEAVEPAKPHQFTGSNPRAVLGAILHVWSIADHANRPVRAAVRAELRRLCRELDLIDDAAPEVIDHSIDAAVRDRGYLEQGARLVERAG
jgi:hypothetical protein